MAEERDHFGWVLVLALFLGVILLSVVLALLVLWDNIFAFFSGPRPGDG